MKQTKLHKEQSTESSISVIQEKREKPPLAPRAVSKDSHGCGLHLGDGARLPKEKRREEPKSALQRGREQREEREDMLKSE